MKHTNKDAKYAAVQFGGDMPGKHAVEDGALPLLGEGELKHESSSRLGWRRICCTFLQSVAVMVLLHLVFCVLKHCPHGPSLRDNHQEVSPYSPTSSTSYFDYEEDSGKEMAPPVSSSHGPPGPFPRHSPYGMMGGMIKRPISMFVPSTESDRSESSGTSSSSSSSDNKISSSDSSSSSSSSSSTSSSHGSSSSSSSSSSDSNISSSSSDSSSSSSDGSHDLQAMSKVKNWLKHHPH